LSRKLTHDVLQRNRLNWLVVFRLRGPNQRSYEAAFAWLLNLADGLPTIEVTAARSAFAFPWPRRRHGGAFGKALVCGRDRGR
jgi:hypothetical protein